MNLAEAKATIIREELPASEAAILLNEVQTCPHMDCDGGCDLVDICENEPYDGIEPF